MASSSEAAAASASSSSSSSGAASSSLQRTDKPPQLTLEHILNVIGLGAFHFRLVFICGSGWLADSMWMQEMELGPASVLDWLVVFGTDIIGNWLVILASILRNVLAILIFPAFLVATFVLCYTGVDADSPGDSLAERIVDLYVRLAT